MNSLFNRLLVVVHDLLLIPLAWFGAYWLRFNLEAIPAEHLMAAIATFKYVLLAQCAAYLIIGSYRSMWGFASMHDLLKVIKAVLLGGLLLLLGLYLMQYAQAVPRSIIPLYIILLTLGLSATRSLVRWIHDLLIQQQSTASQRVLIIGAGSAGESLVRDMLRTNTYRPVAFVDDKPSKQGQEIHGIRVFGPTENIASIVQKKHVELIIFAIPSASSSVVRRIMAACENTGLPIHTLPALQQIVAGQVSVDLLRKVSLEDLLGRDPVTLDWTSIGAAIADKTVLVTGAGGSIGSELCRQICKLAPRALIAVDSSEFNLFSLEQELLQTYPALVLHKYLVDVRDEIAVKQLFAERCPEIVFHAAAYKHVPMLQSQIRAAVSNNIIGTQIVARAALAQRVAKFVLVSTDKAVNPCNIMGASKRAAEIICQSLNDQGDTQFIIVRFGNVLGSAGSVVPIFKQQIDQGGPVTVTHPDIKRYFMTIPEASQLIMQAMTIGKGGEIFVLDMGEPIKISTLAEHMIGLAGKRVGIDIEIKYTGLRPGEKLFEELFYDQERLKHTDHPKILRAYPDQVQWSVLDQLLAQAATACRDYETQTLHTVLRRMVPEIVEG